MLKLELNRMYRDHLGNKIAIFAMHPWDNCVYLGAAPRHPFIYQYNPDGTFAGREESPLSLKEEITVKEVEAACLPAKN